MDAQAGQSLRLAPRSVFDFVMLRLVCGLEMISSYGIVRLYDDMFDAIECGPD